MRSREAESQELTDESGPMLKRRAWQVEAEVTAAKERVARVRWCKKEIEGVTAHCPRRLRARFASPPAPGTPQERLDEAPAHKFTAGFCIALGLFAAAAAFGAEEGEFREHPRNDF